MLLLLLAICNNQITKSWQKKNEKLPLNGEAAFRKWSEAAEMKKKTPKKTAQALTVNSLERSPRPDSVHQFSRDP